MELKVRNVNEAYARGVDLLLEHGTQRDSRYGPVLELDEPLITTYRRPWERVLLDPERDANPFFHLFESLWMLAGRRDVAFPAIFSSKIAEFSDDGGVFHAAYGWRWRNQFMDQLDAVVDILRKDPLSRRAVIQIWDPIHDLGREGKDFPCNLVVVPSLRTGKLVITVYNRSNDAVWGAYGANAVQFSVLQEYLAGRLGVAMGAYHQVSSNFHGYLATMPATLPTESQPYSGQASWYPMFTPGANPHSWDTDLLQFIQWYEERWAAGGALHTPAPQFTHSWFHEVAVPLGEAWVLHRKLKLPQSALTMAAMCAAKDWRVAATQWLERRYAR